MGNVIEFRNITKYFPGVKALDDISFTANGGEVLALATAQVAACAIVTAILTPLVTSWVHKYFAAKDAKKAAATA